jgi:hypothetical protein
VAQPKGVIMRNLLAFVLFGGSFAAYAYDLPPMIVPCEQNLHDGHILFGRNLPDLPDNSFWYIYNYRVLNSEGMWSHGECRVQMKNRAQIPPAKPLPSNSR